MHSPAKKNSTQASIAEIFKESRFLKQKVGKELLVQSNDTLPLPVSILNDLGGQPQEVIRSVLAYHLYLFSLPEQVSSEKWHVEEQDFGRCLNRARTTVSHAQQFIWRPTRDWAGIPVSCQ